MDVKHKPCQYEGCTKRPYFNYQGETHGVLCNEHKQPGMINVGQAPCAEPGCHLAPSFNFPGQKKRLFCAQHKLEGMVNISQQPRMQQVSLLTVHGLFARHLRQCDLPHAQHINCITGGCCLELITTSNSHMALDLQLLSCVHS